MLPDRAGSDADTEKGPDGVFDDLDGKTDAAFQSSRRNLPVDEPLDDLEIQTDDDAGENLLTETPDPDGFDDDYDDAPNPDLTPAPLDDEVLDVLRSEAAFSSARAKLDSATAQALDGDGPELKHAIEDASAPLENEPESEEGANVGSVEDEIVLDDLTAFLDAHSEEADTAGAPEPESEPEDDTNENVTPDETPKFDPLSDLEAIRSQLDSIEPESETEKAVEYQPILPADDPLPDFDITGDGDDTAEIEPNPSDPEDDRAEQTSVAASIAAATIDEDDDFEAERPRRAYRADGGSEQEDDTSDEDTDSAAPLAAAAAAVGLSRPRTKGTRARARTLEGFESAPHREAPADDTTSEPDETPLSDIDSPPEEIVAPQPDRNRRPKSENKPNRKSLLPDVDELDASLRSEADQPRRRDRDMMEAHEEEVNRSSGGGFRRAFIWTLFIIALLLALYVMRPAIIATLPFTAVFLDPYAAVVDSIRLLIDGAIGG